MSHGADQHFVNNRGETPATIAEYLPPEQQQLFVNILTGKSRFDEIQFGSQCNYNPISLIAYSI